jgi:hypothetical protein
MPLVRYFLFAGGGLLALLFISDAMFPALPVTDAFNSSSPETPMIRIHTDRKWPARVVFDTSHPPAAMTSTLTAEASPSSAMKTPAASAGRVRDAFAQLQPAAQRTQQVQAEATSAKPLEPKPQRKRRIAKTRVGPPTVLAAQQPRFGLFDTPGWSSTW